MKNLIISLIMLFATCINANAQCVISTLDDMEDLPISTFIVKGQIYTNPPITEWVIMVQNEKKLIGRGRTIREAIQSIKFNYQEIKPLN